MDCPVCKTSQMVEIAVELRGRPVTMHACSACDTRWWESEGDRIPLESVYRLAGKTSGETISM
jgi:hypothetical protein